MHDAHAHFEAVKVWGYPRGTPVVGVTVTPEEYDRLPERPNLRRAPGLHPAYAAAASGADVARLLRQIRGSLWVGEIGLDYSTAGADKAAQRRVFEALLGAVGPGHILTVHSRGAAADVLAMLRGCPSAAVLHWFTGTPAQRRRAIEDGHHFSVPPRQTNTKGGLALVREAPEDRLLLETDGPYGGNVLSLRLAIALMSGFRMWSVPVERRLDLNFTELEARATAARGGA